MPNYVVKQIQRAQNCATGYIISKYANAAVAVNLNWLPILEGIEYSISKLTFQELKDKNWSSYLPVTVVTKKIIPAFDNVLITFQDQAKTSFNKLPINT